MKLPNTLLPPLFCFFLPLTSRSYSELNLIASQKNEHLCDSLVRSLITGRNKSARSRKLDYYRRLLSRRWQVVNDVTEVTNVPNRRLTSLKTHPSLLSAECNFSRLLNSSFLWPVMSPSWLTSLRGFCSQTH
jgi:hypothetical protein